MKLLLLLPLSHTINTTIVAADVFNDEGWGGDGDNEGEIKT